MSEKRTIGRNAIWNIAGMGVESLTGFLVMPFLIAHLGQTMYGVWIVLGAITGYFGLLDLGIRGAIGRYVAVHHAAKDREGVNRTLTGGLLFLLGAGVLGGLVLLLCQPLFTRLLGIADEIDASGQIELAYRLVVVQFVIFLLSTAFDATLWGFQRFDWLNAVDIPVSVLRLVLTVVLVRSESDLVTLAGITLGSVAAGGIAKAILCFRANPGLTISPRFIHWPTVRQLVGFGTWNLIASLAKVSRRQLMPLLIASLLGVGWVVPYSVADRLVTVVATALAAITGVLTPHAAGLHATNQRERQTRLFMVGGRHTAALAGFLTAGLVVLGGPLIDLWLGPALAPAAALLVVTAFGELLPNTQFVTNGILVATGRNRAIALFGLAEVATVCALAALLLPPLGLIGGGLALAIPAFLTRGLAPLVQGCWLVGVPVWRYAASAVLPSLSIVAAAGGVTWLFVLGFPVTEWGGLVAYSALLTGLAVGGYAVFTFWSRIWKRPLTRVVAGQESIHESSAP